ncbi:hypothetical protein HYW83_06035 [Candidatus Peregrinibacteria bacterium]|nr:hypothetical protein [Candidatus Peregrinibacteria bacterium]
MKSAIAVAHETAGEPPGPTPAAATETRSPYLEELYGLVDEIEARFPDVVRILRERITDLEKKLLAKDGNQFIQNCAIAAMHATVKAVHQIIKGVA